MVSQLINANPVVYERQQRRARAGQPADDDEYAADPIDQLEVFEMLHRSMAQQTTLKCKKKETECRRWRPNIYWLWHGVNIPCPLAWCALGPYYGIQLHLGLKKHWCVEHVLKNCCGKSSLFFCCGCVISLTNVNHIRDIKDPEHPYTLEELKVVSEDAIEVDDKQSYVRVTFTPTVEHCSMATLIGLSIRVKLMRSLPSRYKVDIQVAPGTHATESAVNKQLNDKERVAAALENPSLLDMVEECLAQTYL